MSKLPYVLAAIAIGAVVTLQPGFNAEVARRVSSPFGAAFISILIACLLSLGYLVVTREQVAWTSLIGMPWPLWLAGACGFAFVAGALWLAPVLGAGLLFASIVAGQMIMAVVADHFGLAGYQSQTIDPWRLLGIGLVIAGVLVFQRSA